jgi:hypothetical protein
MVSEIEEVIRGTKLSYKITSSRWSSLTDNSTGWSVDVTFKLVDHIIDKVEGIRFNQRILNAVKEIADRYHYVFENEGTRWIFTPDGKGE